jgi:ArsR family transcriptional regulator, arsenate/arsenite/antimonite-responsive transcriptional repressor
MSAAPQVPAPEAHTVAMTPDQAAHLEAALTLCKALAAPGRLAILGALAAPPFPALTLAELGQRTPLSPASVERDLRQLADAGLIQITEWEAAQPGREPRPARVAFDRAYMQTMAQVIATLHRVHVQIAPPPERPVQDDRTRTITRFMQNGRLISWPAQFKQQLYVLAEVAQAFAPDRTYREREVDAILKDIYAYDHCTLRRALVDHNFLRRDQGIYSRV